ncbi:pentatricopeptide repeat-containing protein At4g08210 isoform X2 [Malania oleifera]|nr:pentatricopeptide repeat-containing protein At4g08210 isoform X2 [Malania oleifera]
MIVRNVVTWTTIVSAYTNNGSPHEAIRLYKHMLDTQSEVPNGFIHSAVLKACGMVGNLELGRLLHERITRAKLEHDTVLMNTLLDMYVKCGSLRDAQKIFDEMILVNSTSWNTIILGYGKEGQMEEAVNLFCRMPEPDVVSWNSIIAGFAHKDSPRTLEFLCMMHREGLKLDCFSLPCVLKTCGFLGLLAMGKQIHCYFVKSGFESCCFTVSALLDMYSSCKELDEAVKLFSQCSGSKYSIQDDLALWNSMLSVYALYDANSSALKMVSQIHTSGAHVDHYTFSTALRICINVQNLKLGLQVHGLVVTSGYELDYIVGSILIDFYVRHGSLKDALRLFHRLPEKDVVAWSGLLAGCVKKGLNLLAFELFRDMVNIDAVDQFVISSVLKACSNIVQLGVGKQVHVFSIKSGYESDEVTLTSLIDMYSKCGAIDEALALFNCMPIRDVVCWTGIIVGCGQNGRAHKAIELFQQMINSGLKPNEITFLGVLSACRHAGLVGEARAIFKSMKTEYGLNPQFEHYYCMVDLLGRAGCFKEAERLIADMPFEPDQAMWSSLLVACGARKNAELISVIAAHLRAVPPKDPSVYATLSNVYATLGMWDDSAQVRQAMKEMGIKEAGKSWIQITS